MKFQGAVVEEQGITFAIVVVKHHVIADRSESNKVIASFRSVFGRVPIVLMAQDSRGVPTYYGRRDIVQFLANVPMGAIPWKEYTLS